MAYFPLVLNPIFHYRSPSKIKLFNRQRTNGTFSDRIINVSSSPLGEGAASKRVNSIQMKPIISVVTVPFLRRLISSGGR